MVAYKNVGDSLDADGWNSLFSYLDGLLTNYLGGLSFLFARTYDGIGYDFASSPSPKVFYFFDPATTPASQLHPLVPVALSDLLAFDKGAGYFRLYNQSAIEAQVASWPIDTAQTPNPPQSEDFQVVRLKLDTYPATTLRDAWNAAIYPGEPYGAGVKVFVNLDVCLSVLKRTINGKPYAITSTGNHVLAGKVEMSQPFEMVEFIAKDSFEIDPSWNKYSMFRIHNFGLNTISVNGISIPSGCCKCLRRKLVGVAGVGGSAAAYSYTAGYNYFQIMIPGDAKFFNNGKTYCNVLSPANALASPLTLLMSLLPATLAIRVLDYSKFWDLTAAESAFWPPVSFSTKIFDLLTHKGDFKIQTNYPAPTQTETVQFTGFDNLPATFQQADSRITFSFNPTTRVCTLTTNPPTLFGTMTDLGTNLWRSLTSQNTTPTHSSGGYIGQTIGTLDGGNNQTGLPGSGHNGSFFSLSQKRKKVQTDTNQGTFQNPIIVTNYTTGSDGADTANGIAYYVTDLVSIISNKIGELNGGLVSASGITLIQTAFGPAIYWAETYPVNSYFSYNVDFYSNRISMTFDEVAKTLSIKRGFLIGAGFAANQFPAIPSTRAFSTVHFPRQPRVYSAERAATTIADSEPWNSSAGSAAYYALQAFTILSS